MVDHYSDIPKLLAIAKKPSTEGIQHLQSLVDTMPWCASYRVLLAKAYHTQDSFQKKKHLRLASTYVGQREHLFAYINDTITTPLVPQQDTESSEIAKAEVPEEYEKNQVEKAITVEPIEVAAANEEVQPQIEDKAAEKIEDSVKEAAVEQHKAIAEVAEKIEASEEPIVPKIALEEPAAESKLGEDNSVKEETEKIDFDKLVKYDPITELQKIESKKERERTELDFDYVAYNPEKELVKLIEKKENLHENSENDFLFWLNTVGDDEAAKKPAVEDKSPDTVQRLLDQFLATKQTRKLKPSEFYSASNKVEESELDKMDVISETLVELYAKQGHIDKAISGYTKLSLQNPDKSAYFAARIKELENKN